MVTGAFQSPAQLPFFEIIITGLLAYRNRRGHRSVLPEIQSFVPRVSGCPLALTFKNFYLHEHF